MKLLEMSPPPVQILVHLAPDNGTEPLNRLSGIGIKSQGLYSQKAIWTEEEGHNISKLYKTHKVPGRC